MRPRTSNDTSANDLSASADTLVAATIMINSDLIMVCSLHRLRPAAALQTVLRARCWRFLGREVRFRRVASISRWSVAVITPHELAQASFHHTRSQGRKVGETLLQ
jgi:hypothetical protein